MAQQGSNNPMLIKPSQIDSLPFLQADAKQQYKNGLANLWQTYESNPEGSQARNEAYDKIKTASTKLLSQLAARNRPQSAGQPRPASQQQGGMQQGGQQMGGGGQQMSPQQVQAAAQARQQQAQQQQQQQGAQAGQQARAGGAMPKLSDAAQKELDSTQLNIPQEQQLLWRRQAWQLLARRDQIYNQARQIQAAMQNAQSNGQQAPPNIQNQFQEAKKAMDIATRNWRSLKLQGEGKTQHQIAQILGPMPSVARQQQASSQQDQEQQRQQAQFQQGPQQSAADSKPPAPDQQNAASPSPSQPQTGFPQQQPQPAQSQQGTPVQQQQQSQPQPQQQTPQTATQPQLPQTMPQQANGQQGMQQPQRPQINTQVSNQLGAQQNVIPQSANQQNPQRPQPLNHQQAMAQAANTYQQAQQSQGPQQGQQVPQMPNGLPFSGNPPTSATQQNTPTYPNLATTQQSSASTKFPIPKQLSLDPRTQQPVAGPPSRPTLSGAAPMYQPGIQRAPPYTLEGEGDRVLSKRKLDELVRQVTGAAPASSDSESSSVLNPDVEESILEMTDNFVDEVITSACRLAKLRPNQTLDLRDIQITLERNYGIRIPGYSLDEVRTVKKFQPAAGWQQKMQAVQAGKVMGSRDA